MTCRKFLAEHIRIGIVSQSMGIEGQVSWHRERVVLCVSLTLSHRDGGQQHPDEEGPGHVPVPAQDPS